MKHMLRKLLAATMAVMMLFSALPMSALAQITVSNELRIGATGYSITGGNQVEVGGSLNLTGTSADEHQWYSNDVAIADVTSYDGQKATVYGEKTGTVEITHRYKNSDGSDWESETIEITVVVAKIIFDLNGGSGTAPASVDVESVNQRISFPSGAELSKAGSDFMGWGMSRTTAKEKGTNQNSDIKIYAPNEEYKATGTKTFYAVWAESVDAMYFIRLNGEIPHEPGSYGTALYSSRMDGSVYYDTFYASTSGVGSHLKTTPSTQEIRAACNAKAGDIRFTDGTAYEVCESDDEFEGKYYVCWYVAKWEVDGFHVDGVLLKRALHNVTYKPNCEENHFTGQIPSGQQYSEGTTVSVTNNALGRTGYDFLGWSKDEKATTAQYTAGNTFEMPAEDVVLYAVWKPQGGTRYKVEYYYQNNDGQYPATAASSVIRTGTTGATVTATEEDKQPAEGHTGYVFDAGNTGNVLEGTIAGDGSLTLKVYFKKQFTVTYEPGEHGAFTAQRTENLDYGSNTPSAPTATGKAGYTFVGWSSAVAETVTGNAVYVAQWTANPNTQYKVEYYLQSLEDENRYDHQPGADVIKTGTTDTAVDVAAEDVKTFANFTYDAGNAKNVLRGTIAGDGSLVLKLYYTRNSYAYVIHHVEKDNETNVLAEDTTGTAAFETSISAGTFIKNDIAGYKYDSADKETLTIGADSDANVINLYYTKRTDLSYTVKYLEKDTNEEVAPSKTVDNQTFGVEVTENALTIAGYAVVSPMSRTITIEETGNEITFYYEKRTDLSYTVKYLEKDTNKEVASSKNVGNQTFGTEISVQSEIVEIAGYKYDSADKDLLTIGVDEAKNAITLYYVKDDGQTQRTSYAVKHVVDGKERTSDTRTYQGTAWLNEANPVIAIEKGSLAPNSYPGYVYMNMDPENAKEGDSVSNGTVITLYYAKRTDLSYTVKYLEKGTNQEVADSKTVNEQTFGTEINAQKEIVEITGYKYDSANKDLLTIGANEAENEITLYYVKDDSQTQPTSYTVKHVVDGKEQTSDTRTYHGTAWISAVSPMIVIQEGTLKAKAYAGYKHVETSPAVREGNSVASGTVITLRYEKDDAQKHSVSYRVEYYRDGVRVDADTQTAENSGWIGEETEVTVDRTAINTTDKYAGYQFVSTAPETIPEKYEIAANAENGGENVIKVYYVKRTDLSYTVKYLEKDTNNEVAQMKTVDGVTFGAEIHSADEVIDVTGYTYDSAYKETLTIGTENSENVITLYYAKRTDLSYTVNYYWNNTQEKVAESDTISGQTYQQAVTVSPKAIVGYTPVSAESQSIVIDVGSNVIDFYYYRDVTLTANGGDVTYNGAEQRVSGFTVAGEVAGAKAAFSQIAVGTVGTDVTTEANRYMAAFGEGVVGTIDGTERYRVAEATNGELVIHRRPVTITVNQAEYTYDGDAKTVVDLEADGGKEYVVAAGTEDSGLVSGHVERLNVVYGDGEDEAETLAGEYEAFVQNGVEGVTIEADGKNVTANYAITVNPGKLTIKDRTAKYAIKAIAPSGEYTYDGKEKTASGVTYEMLAFDGKTYTVEGLSSTRTEKDAGEYETTITGTAVVRDADGNDVTEQFSVDTSDKGKLTIHPAHLTVMTPNASKVYDGTALTAAGTITGFVNGETATFVTTGTQTAVGSSKNTYSLTWNGTAKASNYTISERIGTLTVTESTAEIVVTTTGGVFTYDGQAHGAEVRVSELPKGYTLSTATSSASATDVTEVAIPATCDQLVIVNAAGEDVTAKLKIRKVDGSIRINPAHLTVMTPTEEKVYDGTALTAAGTITGFVNNETAAFVTTGTQTAVGSSKNTYSLTWNGTAKASNYTISERIGTLTVTESTAEIVVTTTGGVFTYDGKAHGAEVRVSELPKGYTLSTATSSASATDVTGKAILATCDTLVIVNAAGEDVTAKLRIEYENDSIKINPAHLTVTTPDASKAYDGEPLTAAGTITGFVNNETATFVTTGTQTAVGNSENTYSLTWNGTAKASNYTISEQIGTLMVTESAEEIVVTTTGGVFTYDGQAHGAEVRVSELPQGYKLQTATSSASATDVTGDVVPATCDTLVIVNAAGEDVTAKLRIKRVDGSIEINPAQLTVMTPDANKVYDGTALTAAGTITGFVNGETATFATTGSQTAVGNSENTYSLTWDGTAKASNYEISEHTGTLTVTESTEEIVVTTTGGVFTYDGKAHGAEVSVSELPQGYTLRTATSNASATDVTEVAVPATCDHLVIVNAAGEDVTAKLKIDYVDDSIQINPAPLTVTTPSASKAYDGTALRAEGTITGFVNGETATFVTTGSQTEVGSSTNTYSLEWDETTKASNYTISEHLGTLTVDNVTAEVIVTIVGNKDTHIYDGDGHSVAGYSVHINNALYTEDDFAFHGDATAERTEAGTTDMGLTAEDFVNTNEIFTNVRFVVTDGSVTVEQRPVTIIVNDAMCNYDGTEKTVVDPEADGGKEYVVAAGTEDSGLVSGHVERLNVVYGDGEDEAETLAGEYEAFVQNGVEGVTIEADGKDVTANYAIEIIPGFLTIHPSFGSNTVVSKSHEDRAYHLGETVEFTIAVKNPYGEARTITLEEIEGVTLAENVFENVAPGAEIRTTATYAITERDIINGRFVNEVTARFSGDEGEYTGTDTVKTVPMEGKLEKSKVTLGVKEGDSYRTKDFYELGDEIWYRITVRNAGNVTYENIAVTDRLTGLSATIASLAPGASETFETSYTVTDEDVKAGSVSNYAAVEGGAMPTPDSSNLTTPVPTATPNPNPTPDTTDKVEKLSTALTVTKTSDVAENEKATLGQTIHYAITVRNAGNVPCTNVVVDDELENATIAENSAYRIDPETGNAVIAELAVGETVTVYAQYVVTEADILAGQVRNTVTAKGDEIPNPENPDEPMRPEGSAETTDETEGLRPQLEVTKTSDLAEDEKATLGQTIHYAITVRNGGNVPCTNVVVDDELENATIAENSAYRIDPETGNAVIAELAVGETVTVYAQYEVTEADILAGQVRNTVTAKGDEIPNPENPDEPMRPEGSAETTDETEELKTALTVTKTATSRPANGRTYTLGEKITYAIHVRNDGNVTYKNVVVEDALEGATILEGTGYVVNEATGNAEIAELGIGEASSVTVNAEYVVTEADIRAGHVLNEATASADPIPDPKDPEHPKKPEGSDDDERETDDLKPLLTVSKTATSTPANGTAYGLGETITYRITVKNDGNVPLEHVEVADAKAGESWTIPLLAVGEAQEFTAEYVVEEADVLVGHVLNEATASADPIPDPKDPEHPKEPEGRDDDDQPTENPAPSLFVSKVTTSTPANGVSYALNEEIRYAITVLNNGNVPVSDITVTDALLGRTWTIDHLAVNETSQVFEGSYIVTEADILIGEVVNVATATGVDPNGNVPEVTDGETVDRTDGRDASFNVVKTLTNLPEKGYFAPGETAEFDITVTNDGNLTLNGIVVTEQLPGASILDGGTAYTVDGSNAIVNRLEPGEAVVVKAVYTLTEADIGTALVNRVSVRGEDPGNQNGLLDPIVPAPREDEEEIPTDDTREVSGVKIWNDADNAYATRPESITLRLMADGVEVARTEANAEGDWTYRFAGLPAHNAEGAEIAYTVTEDAVPGYDSIYAEEGYDVINELQRYTLTIRYWYNAIGEAPAAPTVTNTYFYGQRYDVASPDRTGYAVSMARVTGVIEGDVEYDVIYTPNTYRLTVRYIYQNGATAAPTHRETLAFGDAYSVGSPVLEGYNVSRRAIRGTMPGRNLVYTVIYVPDTVAVAIDEYGVPLGVGNVEMNVGDCFE